MSCVQSIGDLYRERQHQLGTKRPSRDEMKSVRRELADG